MVVGEPVTLKDANSSFAEEARTADWAKFALEGNFAQSLAAPDSRATAPSRASELSRFLDAKALVDAWCAAFIWRKDSLYDYPNMEEVFRRIENNPQTVAPAMRDEIERLALDYRLFNWHLIIRTCLVYRRKIRSRRAKNTAGQEASMLCSESTLGGSQAPGKSTIGLHSLSIAARTDSGLARTRMSSVRFTHRIVPAASTRNSAGRAMSLPASPPLACSTPYCRIVAALGSERNGKL